MSIFLAKEFMEQKRTSEVIKEKVFSIACVLEKNATWLHIVPQALKTVNSRVK
jgi:hypothetical protein